jgi:hypothetical protein
MLVKVCMNKVTGPIAKVRNWIEKLVSSVNKPDGISLISFRFSRTDATCQWMLLHGCQMQQLKPLSWISISKDTFNRKLSMPCIVYKDGFQMQYGIMLAANCPKTPNTNVFVRSILCMNIATLARLLSARVEDPGGPSLGYAQAGSFIILISCLICPLATVMSFTILMRISAC